MKFDFMGSNLIVFLNKRYISEIDFFNKSELEDYFRDLFTKFKDIYNIDISGSYEIVVYIDDNYGVILKLKKDDLDYFDYYDGQVDMSIIISKYRKFLYKSNGHIDEDILSKCATYLYNGDFYILPIRCDYIDMGIIVENSEIIYGGSVSNIINNGKKVEFCF